MPACIAILLCEESKILKSVDFVEWMLTFLRALIFKIILSIKICHSFLQWFITQRQSQFNDSRFSCSAQSIFKIQFLQSFYGLYSPKTEHNFPQKGLNSSQMGLNSPHKGLSYPQTGLNTPQMGLNNCIHESMVNILLAPAALMDHLKVSC